MTTRTGGPGPRSPDLHRRGVGPQQGVSLQIEGVVHVERRMIFGEIEGEEIGPFGLDLGADRPTNPSSAKMPQISSITCVMGWRPPRHCRRPGMVRSRPTATRAAPASSRSRAVIAASTSFLRTLAAPPTALRSAASRAGSCLRISVSAPGLRPRSSVFSSCSRFASACGTSVMRSRRRSRSCRRSRWSEGLLRHLRQPFERRRIPDRQVGQHLAIDLDARPCRPIINRCTTTRAGARPRRCG